MKFSLLFFWLGLLALTAGAQSVSPGGIFPAAGSGTANGVSLDWTIGQLAPLEMTSSTPDPTTPSIAFNPTSLAPFTTQQGTPSAVQSYQINGQNFYPVPTGFTVSAPAGFEVSLQQNGPFASQASLFSLPINPDGTFTQTVYVRLAGTAVGPVSGSIQHSIGQIPNPVYVSVNGTVTDGSGNPGSLQLLAPIYNCQTGAFTFQTTGGNGSSIEYMAIGITGWTTSPNGFVDVGLRTANDVKPLTLRARQNGVEVTYTWDLLATCSGGGQPNPNPGGSLQLVAPLYNCQSGAFTFQTTGGTGSVIEYMAIGITGWTTNPNGFVDVGLRTATDISPLTLRARQSGQEVTYTWDLRGQCPVGARIASRANEEPGTGIKALAYPNPVVDAFVLTLEGAHQHSVQFVLTDLQGNPITDRTGQISQARHEERFDMSGRPAGVYLLRVGTADKLVVLKVLKQ